VNRLLMVLFILAACSPAMAGRFSDAVRRAADKTDREIKPRI
jgi:hypothetical protein